MDYEELVILTTSFGQYIGLLLEETEAHYEVKMLLNVTQPDIEGAEYILTQEPLPLLMLGDKYSELKSKMEKRVVFLSSVIPLDTDADLPNRYRKAWGL